MTVQKQDDQDKLYDKLKKYRDFLKDIAVTAYDQYDLSKYSYAHQTMIIECREFLYENKIDD